MLTTVILEGAMGKKFGKRWELLVNSPAEALSIIEANVPGVRKWIYEHIQKYPNYRVTCVTEKSEEDLSEDKFAMVGEFKEIRFVPVIEGAGGAARVVIGAAMFVAGVYMELYGVPGGEFVYQAGIAMALGGVIEMLTPIPQSKAGGESEGRLDSKYFSGPANTTQQGNPVQLIYGRVLVGSQAISAQMDIDQVVTPEILAIAAAKAALQSSVASGLISAAAAAELAAAIAAAQVSGDTGLIAAATAAVTAAIAAAAAAAEPQTSGGGPTGSQSNSGN